MSKKILCACEESQEVTIAFRQLGFDAYSCDLLPCSGGHPEYHLQQDVLPLLDRHWDLIIAFPPCTHLATSGARWFAEKRLDGRQQDAINFFLEFVNCSCDRIAIENPVGVMSTFYRKPDQIIHPFYFGDSYKKRTCLWLKNLPLLIPTDIVHEGEYVILKSGKKLPKWYSNATVSIRSKIRSKTFPGIAKAMSQQWSLIL